MGLDAVDCEKDSDLPKKGTYENMVYIFCYGLFNSSECNIEAVNLLRRQAFGEVVKKKDKKDGTEIPISLHAQNSKLIRGYNKSGRP